MAVAFDARSEATQNSGTSMTWSHTCSGANRALYVAISHESGSTDVDAVTATYNGTSMDVFFTDTTTHASRHVRVFRLVAPATGANDVVLSWGGLNRAFSAVAASFTGVDQSDPDDAQSVNDGSGGGSDCSMNVSSATDDMVMDVLVALSTVADVVPNQSNTEINQVFESQTANGIAASYKAGEATTTIGWDWTGFVGFMQWGWNINAAASDPALSGSALTGGQQAPGLVIEVPL